jgi:hypothetical protein
VAAVNQPLDFGQRLVQPARLLQELGQARLGIGIALDRLGLRQQLTGARPVARSLGHRGLAIERRNLERLGAVRHLDAPGQFKRTHTQPSLSSRSRTPNAWGA